VPARKPAVPPGAVPAALPAALEPQLATLVDKPRPGDWLYEIKFDGYRMLVRIEGRSVRIVTRRGNDWTARFKALKAAFTAARLPDGWYDGEIVMLDAQGKPDFNALQNAIEGGRNDQIVMFLFDAPFLHGHDLRRVPVEARRAALQAVLVETPVLRFSQEVPGPAGEIVATACKLGLEGVIGKRRGSAYVSRRSDDWIKLKCAQRQEFVIGGYTWPDASRTDPGLGALLVGHRDAAGLFQYAGKVGTGFSGEVSTQLRKRLDAIAQKTRPFAGPTGHDRHAQWVRPELVCEVQFNEWPQGGSLRHASFKGLREDKPVQAVSREAPPRELVKVTHGQRVIDPSTGLTKLDLARYYAEAAPWALPHLAGRHIFIRRAPGGLQAPMLLQEHPEGLRGLRGTDPRLWPGHEPAIAIDTVEDLVNAAQLGMVELHTWNCTSAAIDKADRLVFDIDPGEGVPWPQVQEAAVLLRAMLQELGLQAWLKTSGGKGLHLDVPLLPEIGHDQAKAFARAVVEHMARTIPHRFVARSGAANRVGRIFIDYLRNGQSQTTAAAFSARARPGLGVSMTIGWEELTRVGAGDHWTIANALAHLRQRRNDPWAGYWSSRQSILPALERLPGAPVRPPAPPAARSRSRSAAGSAAARARR